jgi:hypothetical protein
MKMDYHFFFLYPRLEATGMVILDPGRLLSLKDIDGLLANPGRRTIPSPPPGAPGVLVKELNLPLPPPIVGLIPESDPEADPPPPPPGTLLPRVDGCNRRFCPLADRVIPVAPAAIPDPPAALAAAAAALFSDLRLK